MTAAAYKSPPSVELGRMYGFGLEREAERILTGELPVPVPELLKNKQVECVVNGQWRALALWSRIRWQWLISIGGAEVTNGR